MDVNAPTTAADKPAEQLERGFLIRGLFYPFPRSFKISFPVLVKEVSSLDWLPFISKVHGLEPPEGIATPDDSLVLAGLIGCAVWTVNTGWSRQEVARFVEGLDEDEVDVQGVDGPDDEATQGEPEASETTQPTTTGPTPEPSPQE